MISNGSDLLIFESPNDTDYYKKSVDPATTFYKSIKNAIQNVQSHGAVASEPENLLTQPGEGSEMMESSENIDVIAGSSIINPGENMEFEVKTSSSIIMFLCKKILESVTLILYSYSIFRVYTVV